MQTTPELIADRFYSAFKNKDANTMNSLYHQDIVFKDPVFGELDHAHVCGMWQMLCGSAADLKIDFSVLESADKIAKVRWIADYTFGKTKRFVHNEIIANMVIQDNYIIEHTDSFNLHKWARQALGIQGLLLGGTGFFRKKINQKTNKQLERYLQKNTGK